MALAGTTMSMENISFPLLPSAPVPVLEICGATEEQRAAIIDYLLQSLHDRGLHVTSIRRASAGAENLQTDCCRIRTGSDAAILPCDLIIAEGEGLRPSARIRLDDSPVESPDQEIAATFAAGSERAEMLDWVLKWFSGHWLQTPVWACVLIGGRSSRMGRAKHLLRDSRNGMTWLERTAQLLRPLASGLVISGSGEVPAGIEDAVRLADIPGASGPLAGVLAAMRWQPAVSWLVVACDMPDITEDALRWLLSRRAPGIWGTVPCLQEGRHIEPLLSHYDFRCRPLFEQILASGCLKIGLAAANRKVETPLVPEGFKGAWRNVNTVEDLQETIDAG
jgi:molybdopterin-guanine dinucleotide biosynthesis protein A